ncbi:MAG: transketolase [Balneolales bacterium]
MIDSNLEQQCVNTIRTLSMDAVQKANSGHPGMPMGMADAAYVLWTEFLKHNPKNPEWINRDRFILSAGHGSMLLYSLLHLTGYDLPLEELKNFRQWNSKTPGHPEYGITPGVETTTGPLGQGFANGVGMAIAETFLAKKFNNKDFTLIDHYVYAIVSDGDLMEGISQEAASLAGHLKLGKLVYLYDDNNITIDGSTDLSFTEDRLKRFEANGWHIQQIDGHDRNVIRDAIKAAKAITDKPSLISCKTKIGYGSPNKQGTEKSHGAPLGDEEIKLTKQSYKFPSLEPFFIPKEVTNHYRKALEEGAKQEQEWNYLFDSYQERDPEQIKSFNSFINESSIDWDEALSEFPADAKGMATRKASGEILKKLSSVIPNLFGGSADLSPSNNTQIDSHPYSPENRTGRYVHYGVREHAMISIMNGINLHKGLKPYGGTFLIFSDYCRPAIRLAALSKIPTIIVFTHDSVGLGEDGPTHQPVEQLASLRLIPNTYVLRPADANETAYCWKIAMNRTDGPSILALTRQNLPTLDRNEVASADGTELGAYILMDSLKSIPDAIIIGTGSEVAIALKARERLLEQDIDVRVVSMPCQEIFRRQSEEYKESVLPSHITARVSIEAGVTNGWQEWVGNQGRSIGIDHFGSSAPYQTLFEEFGITADRISEEVRESLGTIKAKY